jgi:hypothetical protein
LCNSEFFDSKASKFSEIIDSTFVLVKDRIEDKKSTLIEKGFELEIIEEEREEEPESWLNHLFRIFREVAKLGSKPRRKIRYNERKPKKTPENL